MGSASHDRLARAFRLADEFERLDPRPSLGDFLALHEDLADLLRPLIEGTEEPLSPKPTAPLSPQAIGPYELLEVLGEGSFGIVYRALQREPLRREVALKILRAGMESQEILARFDAERQALALMDHPNIARVIDAGETDEGRPYFVMELVRGLPLDWFCDEARLGVEARLELFAQVCRAMEHAHRKGMVHRDLKPMNVLVTTIEGRPVPKVIDFGIAKALDRKLTEKTLYTQARLVIGTPAYMSPEQARQTVSDVDHRSDVYSLGVILYELLTGVLPIEFAAEATGYDLYRRIWEVEPPRPSSRLETGRNGAPDWSGKLQTDPRTLRERVRGDLDRVIMKCLEKERARRYASARDLADDIDRFLANEPVQARFPSLAYRLRKAFDRQRTSVVAVAIASAVVLVSGISVWLEWNERSDPARSLETTRLEARAQRAERLRLLASARGVGMPQGERWALDEILRRGEVPPDPVLLHLLAEVYRRSPSWASIRPSSPGDIRVLSPSTLRLATHQGAWDWDLETLELRLVTSPSVVPEGWGHGRLTGDGEYFVGGNLECLRAFHLRDGRVLWEMALPSQPKLGSPSLEIGDAFQLGFTDSAGRLWWGRDLREGPPNPIHELGTGLRILPFSPAHELTVFETTSPSSGRVLVRRREEWQRGPERQCGVGLQPPQAIWQGGGDPALVGSWCGGGLRVLFADREVIDPFQVPAAHAHAISALGASAGWLASSGLDELVRVWPVRTPSSQPVRPAFELRGADRHASRLQFTKEPFGLVSMHDDGEVRWWELDADRDERRLFEASDLRSLVEQYGEGFSLHSIAIDPTGRRMAMGGGVFDRGFFRLSTFLDGRSLTTGLSEQTLPDLVGSVAFSSDGERLGVADYGGRVWLIDSEDGRVMAEGVHTSRVTALCFHPTEDRLLSGSYRGELLVWSDTGRGTLESRAFEAHSQRVSGVTISDDGAWIASTSPQPRELYLRPWLADGPGAISRRSRVQDVRSPCFVGSSQLLVAADDHLALLDLNDPSSPARKLGVGRHQGRIFALAYSKETGLLASGGRDGAVLLWRVVADGEIEFLRTLRAAEGNACFHLSFSPDGRRLAGVFEKGRESVVWDLRYYDKHVAGNLAGSLDARERAGTGPPSDVSRRLKAWIRETWSR